MIDINFIWKHTRGGRDIIEDFFGESKECFEKKKNFKLRSDDDKHTGTP